MKNLLRKLVASPRVRHQEAGLDLCYVTENIIATSGPSATYPSLAYRNPLHELVRYLDSRHGDNWHIWEFRAEGTGYPDSAVHDRIWHFPWPDHHPPPFALIPNIMASMRDWLHPKDDADGALAKQRVVVVHCKAGKGRSGSMAVSYLVSHEGWPREKALQRFTERRMRPGFGAGVSIPSQLRYVGYVDRWQAAGGRMYVERPVEVLELHVWGLRDGVKVSIEGFTHGGRKIKTAHVFGTAERDDAVDASGKPLVYRDTAGLADIVSEVVRSRSRSARAKPGAGSRAASRTGDSTPTSPVSKVAEVATAAAGKDGDAEKESGPAPLSTATTANDSISSPTAANEPDTDADDADDDDDSPGTITVFRPKEPILLETGDVNLAVERHAGWTVSARAVASVAHVWFNVYFEGNGPENYARANEAAGTSGAAPAAGSPWSDDSGVFAINWSAMDGIKGSKRKGARAFDRARVVWRAADAPSGEPAHHTRDTMDTKDAHEPPSAPAAIQPADAAQSPPAEPPRPLKHTRTSSVVEIPEPQPGAAVTQQAADWRGSVPILTAEERAADSGTGKPPPPGVVDDEAARRPTAPEGEGSDSEDGAEGINRGVRFGEGDGDGSKPAFTPPFCPPVLEHAAQAFMTPAAARSMRRAGRVAGQLAGQLAAAPSGGSRLGGLSRDARPAKRLERPAASPAASALPLSDGEPRLAAQWHAAPARLARREAPCAGFIQHGGKPCSSPSLRYHLTKGSVRNFASRALIEKPAPSAAAGSSGKDKDQDPDEDDAEQMPARLIQRLQAESTAREKWQLARHSTRAINEVLASRRDADYKKQTLYRMLAEWAARGVSSPVRQILHALMHDFDEPPNPRMYSALVLVNVGQDGSAARVRSLLGEYHSSRFATEPEVYRNALKALAVHPDGVLRGEILKLMRSRWWHLSPQEWHAVAAGQLREGQTELCFETLNTMRKEMVPIEPWLRDLAIYSLCDDGNLDEALRQLKKRIDGGELAISSAVWYYLFDAACSKRHTIAYIWNSRVVNYHLTPTAGQCRAVLATASLHADLALAMAVLRTLTERGFKLHSTDFELLMAAYIKRDDLRTAFMVTSIMAASRIQLTQAALAPLRRYFLRHQDAPAEALETLQQMADAEGRTVPIAVVDCLLQAATETTRNEWRLMAAEAPAANTASDVGALEAPLTIYKNVRTVSAQGPTSLTFTTLFEACAACAETFRARGMPHVAQHAKDTALFLAAEMVYLKQAPLPATYEHLIRVCLAQDDAGDAFRYFVEMAAADKAPDWFPSAATCLALVARASAVEGDIPAVGLPAWRVCAMISAGMRRRGMEMGPVEALLAGGRAVAPAAVGSPAPALASTVRPDAA